ncbi:hypothetical protein NUW54_g14336 [Trametes sanguinea]|uniref:Uncharacterized protein n=1 Tax=Trametes sanguinea TaxID=158606 RepID=A0ACC1MF14_9APHY|nr:hypothetical protein NUW54_g14336 [Trametes sanguinea]
MRRAAPDSLLLPSSPSPACVRSFQFSLSRVVVERALMFMYPSLLHSGCHGLEGRADSPNAHGEEDAAAGRVARLPPVQVPDPGVHQRVLGRGTVPRFFLVLIHPPPLPPALPHLRLYVLEIRGADVFYVISSRDRVTPKKRYQ